jgi:hypothetical protein
MKTLPKSQSEGVKGRQYLGDLSVNGKTIKTGLRGTGWEGMAWIKLAQSKFQ